MKILFIGIFDKNEPNTALRNAFKKHSSQYTEIAWHLTRSKHLQYDVVNLCKKFKPELVFLQLQSPNSITTDTLRKIKSYGAYIVEWTGDARQPLPDHYVTTGKEIDLSLFTNQDDVIEMSKKECKSDYLQVSCDQNIYSPIGSKIRCPEIIFMGNHYNDRFPLSHFRYEMVKFLNETYGARFGAYGAGWGDMATGNVMFKQQKEAEIYRSCKIAINCSHYDLDKYTSDRFFRILMSGAMCLSKEFPVMDEYSPNINFVTFKQDFKDLKNKIDYYLDNDIERKQIALNGCNTSRANWTWDNRIVELKTLIKKWNGLPNYLN
jgi:spore maturation protein CgeB